MKVVFAILYLVTTVSFSYCQDSLTIAQKKKALALNYEGYKLSVKGAYDSSLVCYKQALNIFQKINDPINSAGCQINIAKVYRDIGRYEDGLSILFEAADSLESCCLISEKGIKILSSCLTTIASIHRNIGNFDKSLTYYDKIIDLLDTTNYEALKARNFNNIGNVYLTQSQFGKARENITKSYQLWLSLGDKAGQALTLSNLGLINLNQKKYKDAEQQLLQALSLKRELNNKKRLAATLNNLGLLYISIGDGAKALNYLDEAKGIISKIGALDLMIENLDYKIQYFEATGNHEKQLPMYREYIALNDSLLNQEKVESLADMQIKYETEKKEQSIAMLEKEKELQTADIKLGRLWITILIISIILAVAIGLLIYYRFRIANSNKKKIETLMQELHHRVKNNLQLLSSLFSLQSNLIKDRNALDAVKSGENRINAMAIIHQKLYTKNESRSVNLEEYLTDLIKELAGSFNYEVANENISIAIDAIEVDVDKIIPIGLIVNELVSNTFKYAFPNIEDPELSVKATHLNNILHLAIEDNGPGFDKIDKPENSMGLNIIETLSRQLKAKISWVTDGKVIFDLQMTLN